MKNYERFLVSWQTIGGFNTKIFPGPDLGVKEAPDPDPLHCDKDKLIRNFIGYQSQFCAIEGVYEYWLLSN